jgi:hypothetical protein
MPTVYLLLSADGRVTCVYANRADAEAERDKFNSDPFINPGRADLDAPYSVEAWTVQGES